jgi:hypothetical protein
MDRLPKNSYLLAQIELIVGSEVGVVDFPDKQGYPAKALLPSGS